MPSNSPLISVIIPSYNRANFLTKTIKSIQRQNFKNIEILIVDDGSTDNTIKVLRNLKQKDNRIKIIQHKKNKGEAAARNTGIERSKGNYIAFLDSDDCWIKGKLREQYLALSKSNKNVIGVVCGHQTIDENESESNLHYWHFKKPINQRNLLRYGCGLGLGGNFLMKREPVLKAGKFDSFLNLYVDLDWLCRFVVLGEIISIKKIFTLYNKAQIKSGKLIEEEKKKFFFKNKKTLNQYNLVDMMNIKATFYRAAAIGHYSNGNRLGYFFCSLKALMFQPMVSIKNYFEILNKSLGLNFINLFKSFSYRFKKNL